MQILIVENSNERLKQRIGTAHRFLALRYYVENSRLRMDSKSCQIKYLLCKRVLKMEFKHKSFIMLLLQYIKQLPNISGEPLFAVGAFFKLILSNIPS